MHRRGRMLTLRTLGGAGLFDDGVERPMQPKRLLLLAYLFLEGESRPLSRERLVDLFWPSADAERGRNSLRQALFALRAVIGTDVVVTRGQELQVQGGALTVDALDLVRAAAAGDHARVAALYRDTFLGLGGLTIESPDLDQWLELMRTRFRRLAVASLRTLATAVDATDDERVAWLERLQPLAPHDEADARLLVEAHLRRGDRSAALEAGQAFATRLATELELTPSRSFTDHLEQVRRGVVPVATRPMPQGTATAVTSSSPARDTPHRAEAAPAGPDLGTAAPQVTVRRPWRRRLALAAAVASLLLVPALLLTAADRADTRDDETVVVDEFAIAGGGAADAEPAHRTTDAVRGALAALPGVTVASGERRAPLWLGGFVRRGGTRVSGAVERTGPRAWHAWASVVLPRADLLLARVEVSGPTADSTARLLADHVSAVIVTRRELMFDWGRTVHRPASLAAFAAYRRGFSLAVAGDAVAAVDAFLEAWRLDPSFLFAGVMAASNATASAQYARGDTLLQQLAAHESAMLPLERHQYRRALAWSRSEPQAALRESRLVVATEPRVPFLLSQYAEDAFYANHPAETIRALDSLDVLLRRTPGTTDDAPIRLQALHQLGRFQEELALSTRGAPGMPAPAHASVLRLAPLAALGAVDTLQVLLASFEARDATRDVGRLARSAAIELAAHGHGAGARRVLQQGMEWLVRHPVGAASSVGRRLSAAELAVDAGAPAVADTIIAPLRRPAARVPLTVGQRSILHNLEGTLAARRGDVAAVRRWSDSLAALTARGRAGVETYRRARLAAETGDVAGGLRLLSQALEEGFITIRELHADPSIAVLRAHPRFRELVAPHDDREGRPVRMELGSAAPR